MKSFLLFICSLFIWSGLFAQKQVTQDVILDSDVYKELKINGELNNQTIINPNEGISEHVTVYSGNSAERDGPCDCWIEPDATYTETTFAANGTDDGSTGNIAFPFDFELYGETYGSFWINTNGTVTFDGPDGTFTPTGFPNNDVMLAPFWGDVDFGCADCGTVWYKVTDEAVYVNWLAVGYFNSQSDKVNTFQVIFTQANSSVLEGDNNTQFCYQDMQWTTGSASGGSNGFGGSPANVGASAGNNTDFILFGEFDQEGDDYDGPFDTTDGVSWLDNQTITFNANISASDNLPPLAIGATGCDTIVLCANDVDNLTYTFLAPEDGQNISLSVDDGGFPGIGLAVTEGSTATATVTLTSGLDAGEYNIVLTATDDGTPPASTSINIFVQVLDIVVPDLTITSDGLLVDTLSYCQGLDGVVLDASPGFDSLLWSNNYPLESGTFTQGSYTVTGYFDLCDTEAGPVVVFQIPVFSPDWSASELLLCDGDSSVITFDDADLFPDYEWSIPTNQGEILSEDDENNSITVTSGLYSVSVVDENGCTGASFIPINEEILNLAEANFPQPECDNTVTWTGSWADPNECPMVIFMNDSDGDTWEGGFIEAFVDGAGPFVFNISNAFQFIATGQDMFHGQTIEFFWNPGIDDDDIRVRFFEPGNNTNEIFDTDDGDVLIAGDEPFFTYTADCGYNCLPGQWTATPDVGTFSHPNCYNPVDANQTYTAPADYVGTISFTFESDLCEIVDEFDITFSTLPEISVTSVTVCGDEPAELELTVEPSALLDLDFTDIDWSPNGSPNADGETTANFNNSAVVTVTVDAGCGEAETQGTVEILPIPNPQLSATTICEGTSLNLNPIAIEHPSYEYLWNTNSTDESISVTDAGTYSVTVSNDCGTESASVDLSVTPIPSVQFWASDTLICAGSEVNVNPVWSGVPAEGPVTWSISYTNDQEEFITDTYDSNGLQFTIGSGMVPSDAPLGAIYTYSYANACGLAQGSVAAYTDLCFVNAYNVITPDSDGSDGGTFANGLNEGWQIVGIDGVSGVEVQIFDRWGGLVYESSNYSNLTPWRGNNLNGDPLEDGVYFYTAFIPRGERELNGTVTILRKQN